MSVISGSWPQRRAGNSIQPNGARRTKRILARPLWFPRRLARWARRQPAIAALTCSCLLLLAGVIIVGTASYIRTARALDTAESNLYSHRVLAAVHAWNANDMPKFDRVLEQCPPRLRGWEWGYLSGLWSSAYLVLEDAGGPVDFSPDGRLIATGGGAKCHVRLWDAATGAMLAELVSHTGHVSSVAFSADARLLLSAGGDDKMAILWDVAARQKIGVFQAEEAGRRGALWELVPLCADIIVQRPSRARGCVTTPTGVA